ncbi:ketoacyl-ACP synthase III [Caldisalinibacter kiritimatiensis]|uniref:3-oxoacyl-[acyl-carrier-protein] synthase III n=1 Tax=Caldisalinibacter kiritimatiensis TaxID=1304284 RepID=R1CP28_9FIRM|nr:ketoacyl-ACP synthase III [Caldisalinibacter kiritimatiensis]EOD00451.1 3-oxoacyl-[acyl-carrier-protein] synthase III [Caldisalinibacter kiritimatiensis]
MVFTNVNILGCGIYHPTNKVHNDYFINHFKKKGIEVEGLLKHLEREYRYLSDDPDETVITMGYNASVQALENANTDINEIDLVVFASDTPEYTSPANAIKVLHLLGGKNAKMVYDTNSNCSGMVTAFDQASRILLHNKRFKKALVIGSMLISAVVSENDPISYSNFGDSAAALVLEKVDENKKRGFIDSTYITQTSEHNNILMPKAGYSKVIKGEFTQEDDRKWHWEPFDGSFISDYWAKLIKEVTIDNGIKVEDVSHFIFSQFTNPDAKLTLEKLGVDVNKLTYVGNEYGYTGTTSPFMALHRALEKNKINEGDYLVISTVGSGSTVVSVLYKF